MSVTLREQKNSLRRRLKAVLETFSPGQRAAASAKACARLREIGVWRRACIVLLYSPLPDELDVRPLLREALVSGKTVALPRLEAACSGYLARHIKNLDSDIQRGPFGIAEPAARCPILPLNQLDFVLVPGVGFSLDGGRLGRGKGFYDRLLASVHGDKCGIGFDEQLVGHIPLEPHDIRLDYILTPTRWQRAAGARF